MDGCIFEAVALCRARTYYERGRNFFGLSSKSDDAFVNLDLSSEETF
jgi:hypothetical protein